MTPRKWLRYGHKKSPSYFVSINRAPRHRLHPMECF
nr:MAG TPA: hypothetical protein [Caudoviricetes sp.]